MTLTNVLAQAFGPVRHIIPGFVLLLLLALLSMAGGMYNLIALPYHGERSILFMLATTVYPGPYMFYALFCFFLFHGYQSRRLTQVYYASCVLLALAPVFALRRRMGQSELPFPQQLDEALFDNFIAAISIGACSLAIMIAMIMAARWWQDDSG